MILLLAMRVDTDLASTNGLRTSSAYAKDIRNYLLITISDGGVTFGVLQTLCLLSYYNYTGERNESQMNPLTHIARQCDAASAIASYPCPEFVASIGS